MSLYAPAALKPAQPAERPPTLTEDKQGAPGVQIEPGTTILRILQELEDNHFVHIPGSTYRSLLKWKGATEEDLQAVETGELHAETALDRDRSMCFRQVGGHRMMLDAEGQNAPFHTNLPVLTHISPEEIASESGAKVFTQRSGTREWAMPPDSYRASTVPVAIAKLNELFNPEEHHRQSNLNNESAKVINDQFLIRVNKPQGEGLPTPEGIHQDGTELSSVTLIQRQNVTSGGESRIWKLQQPTGNYSSHKFGHLKSKRRSSIATPDGFNWSNCLFNTALCKPWETILFNDRLVKHEARGFDGPRPCCRDVIVNFIRKPLADGSDELATAKSDGGAPSPTINSG